MGTNDEVKLIFRRLISFSLSDSVDLLEKIGAGERSPFEIAQSSEYQQLAFSEKVKLFNVYGLLLGPFYYFSKGLILKGAFVIGTYCVWQSLLRVAAGLVGLHLNAVLWYWLVPGFVTAHLVSYDLFRFGKKGERIWDNMPPFFATPQGVVGFPLTTFVVLIGIIIAVGDNDANRDHSSGRIPVLPSGSASAHPYAGKCPYVTAYGVSIISITPRGDHWEFRYQLPEEASGRMTTISLGGQGGSLAGMGNHYKVSWGACR